MRGLFDDVADPVADDRGEKIASVEKVIRNIVNRSGVPVSDREDILQEVRLQLVKGYSRFDASRGATFQTWAGGVAKRICVKTQSKNSATKTDDFGHELAGETQQASAADDYEPVAKFDTYDSDDPLWEELHRAVKAEMCRRWFSGLTAYQRVVMSAVLVEGRLPSQVADEIGKPLKDVWLCLRTVAAKETRQSEKKTKRNERDSSPNLFSEV
jgi:RNA polymerase sigma factor (sigma-70 family)